MKEKRVELGDYIGLIKSRAYYYYRCYGVDYDDVEAQGYLIYCLALKDFMKKKASFSTYLFIRLSGGLRDYCRIKTKKERLDQSLEGFIDKIKQRDDADEKLSVILKAREGNDAKHFLEFAKCYLSSNSYFVLKWLLHNQLLEFRNRCYPSLSAISKVINIPLEKLTDYWQEIGNFWNHHGAAYYVEN